MALASAALTLVLGAAATANEKIELAAAIEAMVADRNKSRFQDLAISQIGIKN